MTRQPIGLEGLFVRSTLAQNGLPVRDLVVDRTPLRLYGDRTPVSAQSSDDNLIQRYSEQGQRALADEHYCEAEQAFEKLRDLQPGVAEVYANLGLIYFEERKL